MTSPHAISRADHVTEVIPFPARDGTPLTLVHVTSAVPPDAGAPDKGPVLLVHGAGVRAELFGPRFPGRWWMSCWRTAGTFGS